MVGEVTKKLEDGGLKGGIGAVDDIKNKLGKPGANPADDIDPVTGKKKIPCYSSLDNPNQTPLDYAVAFLFGGVRAEAGCEGAEKVTINGDEYLFDGDFYYKDGKTFVLAKDPAGSLGAVKGKLVEVNDLTFKPDNLNHEYDKHSKDWGINSNRNNANLDIFKQILIDHTNKPNVEIIVGTYKGGPAIFYYEPGTNLTVFTYPNSQVWGAWKFSNDQSGYLKTTGNVN